jgi:NapC/NirT cytochrome c family protein
MPFNVRLLRNTASLTGVVLVTTSAVLFLTVFLADLVGLHSNPYIGILFFLILPAIFLLGLALIPIGAWINRRRPHPADAGPHWPRIDLNDPIQRRAIFLFATLTLANVVIVSLAAYRGVEYMDSVQFCGQVCHTVMAPEFTAYQDGPHARVACVECHIGSGVSSFARSKVSGTRQVLAVTFRRYPRPIPSPAKTLRPARDTCEQCHWPEKFHGDKIRRVYEYAEDETSTESVTTLQIHVGGGSERLGVAQGIHWHMNVANEVEYIATDDKRQVIPWVRLKDRSGSVREYVADGARPEDLAKGERRRMDCMDCHNRPSHPIAATPERAINALIARGDLPKTLPFVRREAVKALKVSYRSQEAAAEGISRSMGEFYRSQQPDVYASHRQDVEKAVRATVGVYRRSVFPEMNVQFGTYPDNIGHVDFPGCFRCHDDNHKSKDGQKISQDCETCHSIQ